ncbi:MAG: DUF1559 domain-containing protein [bacterium]|nr:DUF1559 domain-containing protein [bacterium]
MLPAVQAAREAARRAQCTNNLKQHGLGLHNHHDTFNYLPPGADDGGASEESWGWGARILPYIEQGNLYDQLGVSTGTLNSRISANKTAMQGFMKSELDGFICPSDPGSNLCEDRNFVGNASLSSGYRVAKSNYIGVCGAMNIADRQSHNNAGMLCRANSSQKAKGLRFADVTDGLSNTLMVGERNERCKTGAWVGNRNPTGNGPQGADYTLGRVNITLNNASQGNCEHGFASQHPTGALFCKGDGSVEFIAETINNTVYQNLGKRSDGNVIGDY